MRIARLVTAAVVTAAVAVISTGSPALAHNSLTKAVPAKNATVAKSPAKVELSFLQKVDATKLTIEVTDAQRQKVPADGPEADGKKGVLTFTGALANGTYTVAYSVVSEDGHPVKGSYKFTVEAPVPPSASASATPSATPTLATPAAPPATPATVAAADTSEDDDGPGAGLIIAIVAAVAVIAAGAILVARRRRNPPL